MPSEISKDWPLVVLTFTSIPIAIYLSSFSPKSPAKLCEKAFKEDPHTKTLLAQALIKRGISNGPTYSAEGNRCVVSGLFNTGNSNTVDTINKSSLVTSISAELPLTSYRTVTLKISNPNKNGPIK
jgi:hypothetical protein